ncbi:MAG: 4-hydroxybutyryl-CoA dehydratase, partial [Clostridia bacterium]|nr:4-hydroxybutyryl-CoA dehydratase [Clostridia bacterium]
MSLMSGAEYIDSLRKLNPNLYISGQKVANFVEHPLVRPAINVVAKAYDMALDPQFSDLFTVKSHLTGEVTNRFLHVYQDQDDCLQALRMLRASNAAVGTCIIRCVNKEVINPLWETTYQTDRAHGTDYHERFKSFLALLQRNDEWCAAGITD